MNIERVAKIVAKKWYVIALVILICLTAAFCLSYFFADNYYTSEGKIFVSPIVEDKPSVDGSTNFIESTINSIIDVSKSDAVLSDVINDPALQVLGYSVRELTQIITIDKTSSGIVVRCNTDKPMHSQIIVAAYLNSGVPRIQSIISKGVKPTFNYTIVSEPKEGEKAEDVLISTAILAIAIGGLIGLFIITLPYMAHRKPNCPEYIADDFETTVLGILPKEYID